MLACLALWFGIILIKAFTFSVSAQVVINEFSPAADIEWVEFYNSSDSASYLQDFYIDDDADFTSDAGSSKIKSMSAVNYENLTFPVLDQLSRFFNNSGDMVVLFDPQGNIVDQYQYTETVEKDTTIGRYPDNTGSLTGLSRPTKGAANSESMPSPVPTPKEKSVSASSPKPVATTTTSQTKNSENVLKNTTASVKPASLKPSPKSAAIDTPEILGLSQNIDLTQTLPSTASSVSGMSGNFTNLWFIGSGGLFLLSGLFLAFKKFRQKLL